MDQRDASFSVRLNASEKRLIEMAALALDLPPSRMVRELAVKYAIRVLEDAAADVEVPDRDLPESAMQEVPA